MRNQTVDDILDGFGADVAVLEPPKETKRHNAEEQLKYLENKKKFLEKMFKVMYHPFCNFTYLFIGNREDSKDVVQDAMLTMYKNIGTYDMERPFRPWAFTVLANKAKDYLRKKGRSREILIPQVTGTDPDTGEDYYKSGFDQIAANTATAQEICSTQEDIARVRESLSHLKEHHREIIGLAYYKGSSYDQISVILNIPMGTVKSRLHTAVKNLGKSLEKSGKSVELREPVYSH